MKSMIPQDTSPDMDAKFKEMIRNLSPQERFMQGLELIHLGRQMLIAGYQKRYPMLSMQELKEKMIKEIYFKNTINT